MRPFSDAFSAELLKARRAPVLWLCGAALMILPAFGLLFMYVLRDPDRARRMGLVGQKARLTAGAADWPTLLDLMSQGLAVAGAVLFAFVTAWVFGRESADRTLRTLLALPTSRLAIVAAKGALVTGWCALLSAAVFASALLVGFGSDLPGGSPALILEGGARLATVAAMTIGLQSATALAASWGRGYFPAIGWAFLTLALANICAVLGFGPIFPWSVPALVGGAGGPDAGPVGLGSYALVAVTSALGAAATWWFWERADHSD